MMKILQADVGALNVARSAKGRFYSGFWAAAHDRKTQRSPAFLWDLVGW